MERKTLQRHQLLGVIPLRLPVRRFSELAGDEVVDRPDPAGRGVAPHGALHGGEAIEGQRIGEAFHAQVGVNEDVQPELRDRLARRRQRGGKIDVSVGLGADEARDGVLMVLGGEDGNVKPVARQRGDDPLSPQSDRVIFEEVRNKPHANALFCRLPA